MTITINKLTCNYLNNPLGVESKQPDLSWQLSSTEQALTQTAYQIIVAGRPELLASDNGDLWDSGKIISDQSIHIRYQGQCLTSRQRCFWKVKVWNQDDEESCWSDTATWEMGLLDKRDWQAKWISRSADRNSSNPPKPAPYLRKQITVSKGLSSARAYICGLGYYELFINGQKVGDEVLAPGFTTYDKRALYQVHDISSYLQEGENMIGVILGNGMYNCFTNEVWNFDKAPWLAAPRLLFQGELTYDNNEKQTIISDRSWETADSPIVFDGLRNGEFYDARKEIESWCQPGSSSENWNSVGLVTGPGGILHSQQYTPIRVTQTLKPKSITEIKPGIWIVDLGQNISGWAQLNVTGPAGATITLSYCENIQEDGDLEMTDVSRFIKSGLPQTDKYTLKGDGNEIWEPRFTYHGFRYIRITGFPGTPTVANICGRVVHTDFAERGSFTCSNELLNTINTCLKWSTLTNYHGMSTDCPHREKNGWTGDAHLSAEQALLNFDPMTAYHKWLADFRDAQRPNGDLPGIIPTSGWGFNWGNGPAWDSASLLIPWYVYLYCADTVILEDHYESMKKYVDFLGTMAVDHIVEYGLGDWCPPAKGCSNHDCPTVITDTAYYFVDTQIVAKVAAILGHTRDADYYQHLAGEIRDAFRNEFLDLENSTVVSDCQTSISCAIYQGMINDDELAALTASLVKTVEKTNNHIDCGILGTKYIMNTLSDVGRTDLAYKMATQTDFPSWGHWIEQGATTLWEFWEGGYSGNHHMFSDIGAWYYKSLAGIKPDPANPGFKHILIQPNPVEGLDWVKAEHESLYGIIKSAWKQEGKSLVCNIEIPVNTTATVILPADYSTCTCNGQSIESTSYEIGSGRYTFELTK